MVFQFSKNVIPWFSQARITLGGPMFFQISQNVTMVVPERILGGPMVFQIAQNVVPWFFQDR